MTGGVGSFGARSLILVTLAGLAVPGVGAGRPTAPEPSPQSVDVEFGIEHLLSIRHPSAHRWAPSGNRIAFLWERDGAVDLYWTDESRDDPQPVTHETGLNQPAAVQGFDWTPDGAALVYALRGNLYRHDVESGATVALTDADAGDTAPLLAPDGERLAFLRDAVPWVVSFPAMIGAAVIDEPAPGRASIDPGTSDALPVGGGRFSELRWGPDGRYLAALHALTEPVAEDTASVLGDKLQFWRRAGSAADLSVIDLAGGSVRWLEHGDAISAQASFSSAGRLAWQEISADAKSRRVKVAAPPDWAPQTLVEETDDAWWTLTYLEAGPTWDPVRERLAYLSDRDGFTHAYLVEARAGAASIALTRGEYEVEAPVWSPNGKRVAFGANRGSGSERGIYLLDVPDGAVEVEEPEPISMWRGTSTQPRWRHDGEKLAFLHADPENPLDVWVQGPEPEAGSQLTDSWPEGPDEERLIVSQAVRYASSDGQLVPAQLFLPAGHEDYDGAMPAIVWAHGGGIRQNRFGWHPMRAYAIFYGIHQLLLQRDYVVLMVDYRGSIGYGRDFRTAQHLDLGGRDLEDVLAAARYLRGVEEVEIGNIGVWGVSYGGYLALQALVQAPVAFDAGINVAGVADWAAWAVDPGGLWIQGRMGSAAHNADLYRQRSPIHFVDRLRRPLLTLHGTADAAVPVLQSFRLIDALVEAGKPTELMVYPGEPHVFVRDSTWRDVFRRVEEFFERTLR